MTKLQRLVKENHSYPTNGFTNTNYKNINYHTLNESCKKNRFKYNIWFSENQCMKSGLQLIDKTPTHTVDIKGNTFKVYNISQTDYKLPVKKQVKKKTVSNPKEEIQVVQNNDLKIQILEKLVINLYDKLGYEIDDIYLKELL